MTIYKAMSVLNPDMKAMTVFIYTFVVQIFNSENCCTNAECCVTVNVLRLVQCDVDPAV